MIILRRAAMNHRNESFLQAVSTALCSLQHHLKQQHSQHLTLEWQRLIAMIETAQHDVSEGDGIDKKALIKSMTAINEKLDADISGMENELSGGQNSLRLSAEKLSDITINQLLKK